MTTNVPKGAGRPAAAARSAKHAQRTMLPPKAGSPAAEAISERAEKIASLIGTYMESSDPDKYEKARPAADAILEGKIRAYGKSQGLPPEAVEAMAECYRNDSNIKTVEQALAAWEDLGDGGDETTLTFPEKPMGERTVAELRKMASGLGIAGARDMRKGDLLNAILLTERAKTKISASKTPEEFAAQVFEVAAKSVEPTPPAPKAAKALSEAQGKSMAKADAFLEAAAALGWAEKVRSAPDQDPYGVIVGRGEERIAISWSAGVFVGEECYHSHPARSPRKVINASAAKKIMAIPAAVADEEARKVSAHKAARPRKDRSAETTTERRKALPFDPETATDEEVLQHVKHGSKISWTNEISGEIDSARVSRPSPTGQVRIKTGKSGRSIEFLGETGFRSVRVTSLISVR